jgi:hypothetical protein
MNEITDFLPVIKVTLYPDAGRITRSKTISFLKGNNTLIIKGLPQDISVESIRIALEKSDVIRFIDIFVEDKYINEPDENRYAALKKESDKLVHERTLIEKKLKIYNEEYGLFSNRKNISDDFDGKTHTVLNLKNWEEYLDFARTKLLTNREQYRRSVFEWIELNSRIKTMEMELGKYNSYNVKKEHVAKLVVESMSDIESGVELMYMQSGINWYPAYNLRVSSSEKTVSVTLFGIVSQTTGEDWNDVEIMLSTAKPLASCDIPELKSKRIREASAEIRINQRDEPQEQMKISSSRMVYKKMSKMSKMDESEKISERMIISKEEEYSPEIQSPMVSTEMPASKIEAKKSSHVYPEDKVTGFSFDLPEYGQLDYFLYNKYCPVIDSEIKSGVNNYFLGNLHDPSQSLGGFDYRYKVSRNKNFIPSSDTPVQLTVETKEMPIIMNYLAIPLEKEHVFLKGTFRNNGNPMPSGPVQVFIDNDFLGNIILPTLGDNETTFVSLGIERDIKIVRRENSKRRTQGLIIGKDMVNDFDVEIEIQSFKSEDMEIHIYDRIPVWDKKNNVELFDIKYVPKPDKVSERNILLWKQQLKHGEKKIIKFGYSVKQPENSVLRMSISGTANYEI